jgi:RNA polymerase sigma-70 factor (ECF subfamily)
VVAVTSFDELFAREYDAVVRALTVAAGDRNRAEEWAQDAFATAFRRWRAVSETERPVTWIYVVALRKGRRDLRRDASRPQPQTPAGRDVAHDVATAADIRSAIATLPPRQRTVVVMTYFGGLSTAEIANGLGIAQGTVKATLHQARQGLAHLLTEEALECP